jgi:hypothetical protein
MTIDKFEVRNRGTNAVQFTAEIEVTPGMTHHVKLGLAVRWGYKNGSDLRDANLSYANLSYASLRGANLPPVKIPDIHKAIYAAASQPGALDMRTWHCGTTHCRAGWVVALAGEGGAALEWAMGTSAAAAMIYIASDPALERIPNFHATNDDALADMQRLAEQAT